MNLRFCPWRSSGSDWFYYWVHCFLSVRCYEFALRWITILCLDELTHGVEATTNEFYCFTIGPRDSKSYYIDWVMMVGLALDSGLTPGNSLASKCITR